jgi:hypothetical protein
MTNLEIANYYGEAVAARVTELRNRREAALAAPQDLNAASAFGEFLYDMLLANFWQINGVDWRQYIRDAVDVIGTSTAPPSAPAEQAADAMAVRAELLGSLNEADASIQGMRDAYARAHTYRTGLGMIRVYGSEKNWTESQTLCEETRPLAADEDEAFALIEACLGAVAPKESIGEALPWITNEDREMFERRYQERAEARLAAREAEASRRQATMEEAETAPAAAEAVSGRPPAPFGPAWVSFTLRNTCSKTVKLFYGKTPKYGSGRSSSIGGNTSQSESMNEGDMIWIVDDSGNGLANFSASAGARQVEINSSCTSFIVR